LDHQFIWHPFTQMQDWLSREPTVIVSGQGAVLRDAQGREYLDANSSIWTNLHGHNHPRINGAIRRQLGRIAHSSALGLANEPASLLAEKLVELANRTPMSDRPDWTTQPNTSKERLAKVFYSDDGSTGMEVAVKLAYEYTRRTRPDSTPRFLSLENAYHGDTLGAVSVGHIDLFHKSYAGLLFDSDKVMAPYCYRCPFNQAKPERADARVYRKCKWECVAAVEQKFETALTQGQRYSTLVAEPLVQGAAGMIPQPEGWLARVGELTRSYGAQLVADEVMTGFGRTGMPFACHKENIQPDFLVLAKGLTGGYLPMAATLTTQPVFDAFLGRYDEFRTFFHGHSYTGNQLGAAAALASLELLDSRPSIRTRRRLEQVLRDEAQKLWTLPNVGDVRQVGLIVGVELVKDWRTRQPFELEERAGIRVCEVMAERGVLTRPIGNVIVLMPPYCTDSDQASRMVGVLGDAIRVTFGA
jgi:adenosylmethionine-8-amino-7-oxononanoate aminotransferase